MLDDLKLFCERLFLEQFAPSITADKVAVLFQIAHLHRATYIQEYCKSFAKRCAKAVSQTEGYQNLPSPAKREFGL
jgi:hypothetical protein